MQDASLSSFPVHSPGGDERSAHLRIQAWLEGLISSGVLEPEDRLPAEVEMASAFGVSRTTLRQALGSLESKGFLIRKRGRWGGTFIARPKLEYDLPGLLGFTEQMRRSQARPGARVIDAATMTPTVEVRQALRLGRRGKVHRVVRVRSANGEPVALEESSYPAELLPDFLSEALTESLYALLGKRGYAPFSATEVLEPVKASADQAALLNVEVDAALLLVARTAFDREGTPIEHALDYFRPDRMRIVLRTQVDGAPHAEVLPAPRR